MLFLSYAFYFSTQTLSELMVGGNEIDEKGSTYLGTLLETNQVRCMLFTLTELANDV